MRLINILSREARQQATVILPDATLLKLTLTHYPNIQRWCLDVVHPTLTVVGKMLSMHPNLLRPWRNVITFGIACTTLDGADPFDINDFSNGRAQLYVLDPTDLADVEANVL